MMRTKPKGRVARAVVFVEVIKTFLYYRCESRVARLMKMDYRTVINILQSEEAQTIIRSLGVEDHPMKEEEESLPMFSQESW